MTRIITSLSLTATAISHTSANDLFTGFVLGMIGVVLTVLFVWAVGDSDLPRDDGD